RAVRSDLAPAYCSPESSSEKNERCWAGHFSYPDWRARFRSRCMCRCMCSGRKIQQPLIERPLTFSIEVQSMIYRDRIDAGKQLAARLADYADRDDVLVLALPRGGVPVAYEVAKALRVSLDIFLVRKLGVPG